MENGQLFDLQELEFYNQMTNISGVIVLMSKGHLENELIVKENALVLTVPKPDSVIQPYFSLEKDTLLRVV